MTGHFRNRRQNLSLGDIHRFQKEVVGMPCLNMVWCQRGLREVFQIEGDNDLCTTFYSGGEYVTVIWVWQSES